MAKSSLKSQYQFEDFYHYQRVQTFIVLSLNSYFYLSLVNFFSSSKFLKVNVLIQFLDIYIQSQKFLNNLISLLMNSLVQNTTIKLNIDHNISSSKVIQARFDLNQTILAVKENIQGRYGSLISYMRLQLKDIKNNLIADLDQDQKTLASYGAQTGMIIFVIDTNPNSILKEIQSYESVEKYMMSEQDYEKLPENFRKWKKSFLKDNPNILHQTKAIKTQQIDSQYLGQLASTIKTGSRCKLNSGARGQVKYVGKIMDLGQGYFAGIKLDQPFGDSNGIIKGVKYFDAHDKYASFVRPNALQIGDFPVLDIDDQI